MEQTMSQNGSSLSSSANDTSSKIEGEDTFVDQSGRPIDERLGAPLGDFGDLEKRNSKVEDALNRSKRLAAQNPTLTLAAVAGVGALATALLLRSSRSKQETSIGSTLRDAGSQAFKSLNNVDLGEKAKSISSDASEVLDELEGSARRAMEFVEKNSQRGYELARDTAKDKPILTTCIATGALSALAYAAMRFKGGAQYAANYEDWTKEELYERAKQLDVEGRSAMSKEELISALRECH